MTGPLSNDPPRPAVPETRIESLEEIQRAVAARQRAARAGGADADTQPFRPVRRPPSALLCILTDSGEQGEWIHVRTERLVIGRSEGDVTIPNDTMMSARHAEIAREGERGRYTWSLTDLESTNGTYVRVSSAILKHGQEVLLGNRRYRFDAYQGDPPPTGQARTEGWDAVAPIRLVASLVELTAEGDGQRFPLPEAEHWIGRDASQASVVLANDPLVSPRHARLHRSARGTWHLENAGSLNGTWLRITRLPFAGTGQFRLGEQRFVLKVP